MTKHQKVNVDSSLTILLSTLVFILFSPKKSLNTYYNNISLPFTLAFSTGAPTFPRI